jgi:predicted lactoylglutathione lyase
MQNYWVTLAASDLDRARTFYETLGWLVRPGPSGVPCLTAHLHDGVTVCFFESGSFAPIIIGRPINTREGREVVQSIAYPDRSDVDAVVARAAAAGAGEVRPPADAPFGYAGGFTDPDGHVYAVLWMPA